eukprot:13514085-Alexandrium_andersonii.AAC.1
MSASLVGSEMCIRDRSSLSGPWDVRKPAAILFGRPRGGLPWGRWTLPGSSLRCSVSGVVALLWGPPA